MSITVKDIALELGVSQSTVSRILNGVPHRVSEQTRARVVEAARRLDYQPNGVARSLRDGRSRLLGFYDTWADETFDAEHEFMARVIGGLQRGCAAANHDLVLHSPMRGRPAEDVFRKLASGHIDGLILHGDTSDPLVERLVRSSIPVVVIVDRVEDAPSVTVHDWDGVRQIVEYLWERRYQRFAFMGPRQDGGGPMQRGYDFRGMLFERGVKEIPIVRMDSDMSEPPTDEILELQRQDAQTPLCVFCWNDRAAYALLRECLSRGVRIPEQLAVVGFDGFLDLKLPALRLTTVYCPWAEVSAAAVGLLLRRIAGEDVPRETLLPPTLVVGNTA